MADIPKRQALPIHEVQNAPESSAVGAISGVLSYHHRTKHHLDRYARSLGHLDWATQPDPFRVYRGAPRVELPLAADGLTTPYSELFVPGAAPARPIDLTSIGILLELALGLSAWKEFRGNRWALRCNPSSGNLHPTEGYAILPPLASIAGGGGVYHYVSRDHCLEQRCVLAGACDGAAESVLVGLSSISWREAWKYGERAYRYCQHDAGHAIAAVRYAAAALGWSAVLLDSYSDDDVAAVLGLDRDADFADVDPLDRERPVGLILVSARPGATLPRELLLAAFRAGQWAGKANALSPAHVNWKVIDEVAGAARKPTTPLSASVPSASLPSLASECRTPAAALIRQRRSCLDLDGQTPISSETFYHMLDCLLPRPGVPPWDVLPWTPRLHAAIFVHRVEGLDPGLYLLERDPAIHDRLRAALQPTFLWELPATCPKHLRLFCLMRADLKHTAQVVSCQQEIASDGAFSLGMIADFKETIRLQGPWWYRRLFWEAGVVGQTLYLEAEAAGIRSTGIGCYFDDEFHKLLGLTGDDFQDLYHFTVGTPVEDRRLLTLPPYDALARSPVAPKS